MTAVHALNLEIFDIHTMATATYKPVLKVTGAGVEDCNGTYASNGRCDGGMLYVKILDGETLFRDKDDDEMQVFNVSALGIWVFSYVVFIGNTVRRGNFYHNYVILAAQHAFKLVYPRQTNISNTFSHEKNALLCCMLVLGFRWSRHPKDGEFDCILIETAKTFVWSRFWFTHLSPRCLHTATFRVYRISNLYKRHFYITSMENFAVKTAPNICVLHALVVRHVWNCSKSHFTQNSVLNQVYGTSPFVVGYQWYWPLYHRARIGGSVKLSTQTIHTRVADFA